MQCNQTIFGVSGLTRVIFEEKSSQSIASFLQPDRMEASPFQRLRRFFSLCARKLLSPTQVHVELRARCFTHGGRTSVRRFLDLEAQGIEKSK